MSRYFSFHWQMLFVPVSVFSASVLLVVFDILLYRSYVPFYGSHMVHILNLWSYFFGGNLDATVYTTREMLHLIDVRRLLWLDAGLFLVSAVTFCLSLLRAVSSLRRQVLVIGGIGTIIVASIFSLLLLSFSSVFVTFHQVFFTNDLWLLPADSMLITMFPESFFSGAFIRILLYSIIFSTLSIIIGVSIPGAKKHDHKSHT